MENEKDGIKKDQRKENNKSCQRRTQQQRQGACHANNITSSKLSKEIEQCMRNSSMIKDKNITKSRGANDCDKYKRVHVCILN